MEKFYRELNYKDPIEIIFKIFPSNLQIESLQKFQIIRCVLIRF